MVIESTLGALFIAGLLGGVGHCLGMCGPLVALAGIRLKERRAGRPAENQGAVRRPPVMPTLVYHGARIAVYAALGATVGAVGSLVGLGRNVTNVGAALGIAIGLLILAMGLGYAGLLPAVARERGGRWWSGAAAWALRRPGVSGAALLGALNGLLPCGLVYGALLAAAGAGSAGGGALYLLVFGAATFPALAIVQTGAGVLHAGPRLWLLRAAGVVVVLVGIQLCLRSLATFGVVPSAHLGELMLW